ncbi:hypothetical protein HNV11_10450 [Spirosoma taeanense]|uniref:WD40-like Beta Propeller Repeat n=1 Tax=Spirosoma taeanense TaxID=2735870 RepID=A0A6M5Y943_9BACT|nr:PD40 domain-containing protein [Spirosoma taeanense]QJW89770.1 hypothetical protein HNV11_10450 [Spirosoma taeanense]
MKGFLLMTCLLAILASCDKDQQQSYKPVFSETPVNLGKINSVDDDYNSNLSVVGEVIALTFSSKRGGRSDFNFVQESFNYAFDTKKGTFSFDNQPYGGLDVVQEQRPVYWATDIANSTANELGPYIRSYDHDIFRDGYTRHYGEYLMLFASDRTGNLDIYLTHNYQSTTTTTSTNSNNLNAKTFTQPVRIPCLNSSADDGYPTFDKTYSAIYFTSNRAGSFDLYKAILPDVARTELHSQLPSLTNVRVERVAELSSTADDKCPFIDGNMMVFTSNRPGGYGGYDLYYSKWDGSQWSTPVNFGPTINTSHDEYRPILNNKLKFSNQLMIFSSNRPGGKGGFDLYMVGIPR